MKVLRELPARQMFTIPNDLRGRIVLWFIRRYLNTDRYKIVKRGRGAIKPVRYAFGVELSNAKRIGVYIDDRFDGVKCYDMDATGDTARHRYTVGRGWTNEQGARHVAIRP